MHMFRVQPKGIQLNFDSSCLSIYISDKPDSKAHTLDPISWRELEMKGYTQIEGQSTQGSDK